MCRNEKESKGAHRLKGHDHQSTNNYNKVDQHKDIRTGCSGEIRMSLGTVGFRCLKGQVFNQI
jgi:hypothetical protein